MYDYTPNSHKYKEEQKAAASEDKKLDKVVTGSVQLKQKNALAKLSDVFIAKDAKSVGQFILKDVIIPNMANLLEDIAIKGIRMFLRGDAGPSNSTSSIGGSYVSYNQYSNSQSNQSTQSLASNGFAYKDIVIKDLRDAEQVLKRLREAIAEFGSVSVGDLYDLIGETCPHTANYYGWTNLANAELIRVRDGYFLKLPKALSLK